MNVLDLKSPSRFGAKSALQARKAPSARLAQSVSPMSIKKVNLGTEGVFSGYLSVFGNVDFYGEVVQPGAWAQSIADWEKSGEYVPLLWQHLSDEPIGVWRRFEEDKTGLWGEAQVLVDAGPMERRAWAHIQAGSLKGLSPGYYLEKYSIDDAEQIFYIDRADLREGSLVTFPANKEAQVDESKKATLEIRRRLSRGETLTVRQMEFVLRDECGLSNAAARAVIERGYKSWAGQDAGSDDDLTGWNDPPSL